MHEATPQAAQALPVDVNGLNTERAAHAGRLGVW